MRMSPSGAEARAFGDSGADAELFAVRVSQSVEAELIRIYKRYRTFALVVLVLVAMLIGWKFYDLHVLSEKLQAAAGAVDSQLQQVQQIRERIVASSENVFRAES